MTMDGARPKMGLSPGEIEAELNEHTMLSLMMAIFSIYAVMSLGIYLARTLSPESFYSITASAVLVTWAYKEPVIEFISPALLRLFGAGGQGYLHLLSLWFVDPRDLTLASVASRVLAGSYTAVLAAIFFVPLFLAVCIYAMNLYEALSPQTTDPATQRGNAAVASPAVQQEREERTRGNAANHARVVSVSTEAPLVFEPEPEEDRWLLTEFDMDAFLVMCPLGKGVTSQVLLAQVDLSRVKPPAVVDHTQNGSLFASRAESVSSSSLDDKAVGSRQEGSFWAESGGSQPHRLSFDDDTTRTAASTLPDQAKAVQTDMLDDLLTEVEESARKQTQSSKPFRAFGPGGGPITVGNNKSEGEGGWRKLEPELMRSRSAGNPPPEHGATAMPPMYNTRQLSRGSTSSAHNNRSTTNLAGLAQPQQTIMGKMRMNSQSMTALSDLAGKTVDGDNWWRPLQWLDEVQRRKSGMDEVFAVAPGLAENLVSISDLAQLDRAATVASSRSSVGGEPIIERRRGSLGGPGSEGYSPKLAPSGGSVVRFSTFPSVLSLTESELINLEDHDQEESGGRRLTGMEEMPDLVAIKIMRKIDIERMGLRKTVENERRALAMCASPFVCNIFGAFQDQRWAYLLLEPVPAGDLAGLLEQRNVMFEDEARFYVGCLLLALEHLHARGIACLDVKPENLLLDEYGYCKLCDLGIARIFVTRDTDGPKSQQQAQQQQLPHWEFVGTPEYMSPEVVCRHKIAPGLAGIAGPDLWAAGVLLFELLAGETPFAADTNTEVVGRLQKYLQDERASVNATQSAYQRWTSRITRRYPGSKDTGLNEEEVTDTDSIPPDSPQLERVFEPLYRSRASPQARDLVRHLLRTDPRKRLGCLKAGARTCMDHGWFTDAQFDWRMLRRREMRAPFVPNPITLAPPFRGEPMEVDMIREKPLSLHELQMCQDYLKGHGQQADSGESSWKGFGVVTREAATPASRRSGEFQGKVRHVQNLFRHDLD